jgi:uncharacterized protein
LRRKSRRDRLKSLSPTPLRTATVLLLVSAFGLVLWLSDRYDPALHEPVVHLRIEPIASTETASITGARPADSPADDAVDLFSDTESSSQELQTTETRTAVIVAPRIKLAPAPAKGFVENGSSGPLPKLSSDGRRPFDAYARPVHRAILQSSQPKIAILLGGMGLNGGLTNRAVRNLPEEVTLAFAPYGANLQQTINDARDRGHEVMLQLPMEPFGYPNLNPGPHTLLVSADSKSTAASLSWLLSRFTGYTGVVNYLGARFTSQTSAMIPVIQTLKDRGLVYLEDGSSQRSVAQEIAAGIDLPVLQADVIIDGEPNFSAITAKLQKLEQMSRDGRIVIGVGTGLPATIDAMANWTQKLAARGILLVPVSAAFRARPG